MNANAQHIKDYLLGYYPPEEWPSLLHQAEEWAKTKPLAGLRVLDACPIFRNTLGKFMALLAAGAEVYVPRRPDMPCDPAVTALLPDFGIHTAEKGQDDFDIVLDCAAKCARCTPSLGYAELTRSGVPVYERTRRPVIVADAGRIFLCHGQGIHVRPQEEAGLAVAQLGGDTETAVFGIHAEALQGLLHIFPGQGQIQPGLGIAVEIPPMGNGFLLQLCGTLIKIHRKNLP